MDLLPSSSLRFLVDYQGSPLAHETVIDLLLQRGWSTWSEDEVVAPSLRWQVFSKINWQAVLDVDERTSTSACTPLSSVVGSYPLRSALIRKDKQAELHRRIVSAALHTEKYDVLWLLRNCIPQSLLLREAGPAGRQLAAADNGTRLWVLKDPTLNNSLGIHLLTQHQLLQLSDSFRGGSTRVGSPEDRQQFLEPNAAQPPASALAPHLVAQRYVESPLLLDGCKFHCRVNVLCIGALAVYAHSEVICHVACEPFEANRGDLNNRFAHVTNHTVQRSHPSYNPSKHTVTLATAIQRISAERRRKVPPAGHSQSGGDENGRASAEGAQVEQLLDSDAIFSDICTVVKWIFVSLVQGRQLEWPLQLPQVHSSSNSTALLASASEHAEAAADDAPASTSGEAPASIAPELASTGGNGALGPQNHDEPLPPPAFLPIRNGFEVYGFDFLLSTQPVAPVSAAASTPEAAGSFRSQDAGSTATAERANESETCDQRPMQVYPVLLEVNSGPALEGLAWPMMCRRVIGDILELVVDQFVPSVLGTCSCSVSRDAATAAGTAAGASADGADVPHLEPSEANGTPSCSARRLPSVPPEPGEGNCFVRVL